MGLDLHTVEIGNGSTPPAMSDRLKVVMQLAVPTAAGEAAGDAVTTAVSGLDLPAKYIVCVESDQDSVAYVSNKTQSGFDVVLNPRLAANTLAAGTINLIVFG